MNSLVIKRKKINSTYLYCAHDPAFGSTILAGGAVVAISKKATPMKVRQTTRPVYETESCKYIY